MSSKEAVFSIPEFLGMILLNLDPHTLLTSARVCRHWRHIINDTPSLQEKHINSFLQALRLPTSDNMRLSTEDLRRRILIAQLPARTLAIYREYDYFPTSHYCNVEVKTYGAGFYMGEYYDILAGSLGSQDSLVSVTWTNDKTLQKDPRVRCDPEAYYPDNWQESIDIISRSGANHVVMLLAKDKD
ncbi:hypothetical protein B0T10DRAFT_494804 [Thelonectria olida]|uniref:F-box domain-containing protein n=1 Tax=Thelonectria olida TaxID=1576542 RepID=A0A9P9ALI3_9HYPO|nr:hypothetical protein B0T10DRAFT_494804 [Thelonectria olida]